MFGPPVGACFCELMARTRPLPSRSDKETNLTGSTQMMDCLRKWPGKDSSQRVGFSAAFSQNREVMTLLDFPSFDFDSDTWYCWAKNLMLLCNGCREPVCLNMWGRMNKSIHSITPTHIHECTSISVVFNLFFQPQHIFLCWKKRTSHTANHKYIRKLHFFGQRTTMLSFN